MVPTYGSNSGAAFGAPIMQDAAMPALDMSSYTVYEWMESELGLGLTKPLEAKVYAMIYQASMHHRGYFQINQTEFCKQVGVARQTLNRVLKGFVECGLVLSVEGTVSGCRGGGTLESSAAYLAAQGPINAAVVSVMDAKRLKAAREWSTRVGDAPMPGYLANLPQPQNTVINNPQVAPLSQNVTADSTCGNVNAENRESGAVENTAVAKCDSGATCENIAKPQVTPLSQNVTAVSTCGNAEKAQVGPLSQKTTAVVTKCDSGATCGNSESDTCLLEPSTCGSDNKTPGRDFDQAYIDEGGRMKEDLGMYESFKDVPQGCNPLRFVGGPTADPSSSFRSLTPSEHEALATFLAHWPKDVGTDDAFEETARAWSRLMDTGYTPDDVLAAADAYLSDFNATHDLRDRAQMRFLMFPKSFLTRPEGLRKWLPLCGRKAMPVPASASPARQAPRRRTPGKADTNVFRVNGDSTPWAYRDRYGNVVALGTSSVSMSREEATELAKRLVANSWDGGRKGTR